MFLASLAEEVIDKISSHENQLGFILIKKLYLKLTSLHKMLTLKSNNYQLEMWDEYTKYKDFKKIYNFVCNENELFGKYYQDLKRNINKQYPNEDAYIQ